MSGSPELRLALVGAGKWGRNYIAAIGRAPGARLATLCSRNPQASEWVPAACRVEPDWRTGLDPSLVDAAVVATPPATHFEIARHCLERGIPVLVEKPLTLDLREAETLDELARARGCALLTNHIQRFNPAFLALKRFATEHASELGRAVRIRSEGGNHGPFRPDYSALWDYGPHDVALCLDLLGQEPTRVRASRLKAEPAPTGASAAAPPPTAGNFALQLEFGSSARAEIRAGNLFAAKTRRFEVVYENGEVLVFDDLAPAKLIRLHRGGREALETPGPAPLDRAVEELARRVRAPGDPDTGARVDLGTMRVLSLAQAQLDAEE